MSAPTTDVEPAGRDGSPGRAVTAVRWVVVVVIGVVLLALVSARGGGPDRPLDPTSAQRPGARALVQVLADQGVQVTIVRGVTELGSTSTTGATVVVTDLTRLSAQRTSDLLSLTATSAELVLVGAEQRHLEALGANVTAYPSRTPDAGGQCPDPLLDGLMLSQASIRYVTTDATAVPCLGIGDEPTQVATSHGQESTPAVALALPRTPVRAPVRLLGTQRSWANATITEADNAAVALRLLGQRARLVWVTPSLTDGISLGSGDDAGGSDSGWPPWRGPLLGLLGSGVVLLAFARGRRLGPLSREPLPVLVPAAETVVSRARLYRASHDPSRAAAILRLGTIGRLAEHVGLRREDDVPALCSAVARAAATDPEQVHALLAGPLPHTERDLVDFATSLSDLEEKVRHP